MASINQKGRPKSKRSVKSLTCPKCSKSFQHFGYKLTKHIQKHCGYHPFKCGYCDFLPADKEEMLQHNQKKHLGQKLKVFASSFTFPTQKSMFEELMKKIKQCEKTAATLEYCSLCGEKFYSRDDYRKHLDQIHDVILEDDDDIRKNNKTSKRNVDIYATSKSGPLSKQYSTEINHTFERAEKFRNSGEIFKCSICEFICNDKFATKMHTIEAHKDSPVEAKVEKVETTPSVRFSENKQCENVVPEVTQENENVSTEQILSLVEDEYSEIISSILAYDQEIKELNLNHQKNGCSLLEHAIGDNFSIKGRKKFERPEDWLCPDCNRQNFNSLCSFLIHLRCHANFQPYGCKQCPFRTADRSEIKRHTDQKHPGLKPELRIIDHEIVQKAKYFNLLLGFQKLNIKTNLITVESFYICRICYSFGTFLKSQFMQHQKKCLSNKSKLGEKVDNRLIQFQTKVVTNVEQTNNKRPLENIESKDSTATNKTHKICPFCQYKTISPKLLVEHILAKHPQSKTPAVSESKHACKDCGVTFHDQLAMKHHKCNKEREQFVNLVECLVCKKQLPSDSLQMHLQLHSKSDSRSRSAEQKVFKKFKSHKLLLLEDPNYWLNVPPLTPTKFIPLKADSNKEQVDSSDFYICRLCERSVPSCAKRSHIKLHQGVFKFRCKYCPYRKVFESNVQNHIKKIHKGKPEELLKMSPEDWMQTDNLIQNSIQQLSEIKITQKWQCNICKEEFSNNNELKIHKANRNRCLSQIKFCRLCHKHFEDTVDKPCIESKEHIFNKSKLTFPPLDNCRCDSSMFDHVIVAAEVKCTDLICEVVVKNIFDNDSTDLLSV